MVFSPLPFREWSERTRRVYVYSGRVDQLHDQLEHTVHQCADIEVLRQTHRQLLALCYLAGQHIEHVARRNKSQSFKTFYKLRLKGGTV